MVTKSVALHRQTGADSLNGLVAELASVAILPAVAQPALVEATYVRVELQELEDVVQRKGRT